MFTICKNHLWGHVILTDVAFLSSLQEQSLSKSKEVHTAIQKLSSSYTLSATMMAGTKNKIEELGTVSTETNHAIQELAGLVIRNGDCVSHISRVVETLRDQFERHMSTSTENRTSHLIDTGEQLSRSTAANSLPESLELSKVRLKNKEARLAFRPKAQSQFMSGSTLQLVTRGAFLESIYDTSDQDEIPQAVKSSNYHTWLGEVYIQTVRRGYESEDLDMWKDTSLCSVLAKTEILLLPKAWRLERGAHVVYEYQQFGPQKSYTSMEFRIQNFTKAAQGATDVSKSNCRYLMPIKSKAWRSESFTLLATAALRSALHQVKLSSKRGPKSGGHNLIVSRESFDNEVNDVLELVQLCVYGGLDAKTVQETLPSFRSYEYKSHPNDARAPGNGFHFRRARYVGRLTNRMITHLSSSKNIDQHLSLTDVHQDYWDECQRAFLEDSHFSKVKVCTQP